MICRSIEHVQLLNEKGTFFKKKEMHELKMASTITEIISVKFNEHTNSLNEDHKFSVLKAPLWSKELKF